MRGMVFCAILLLAGCGPRGPSALDLAMQQYEAESAQCPQSPAVTHAKCVQEIERRVVKPVIPSAADLLDVMAATRMALSVRIDRGEIRKEDADLEMARTKSQLVAEFQRRGLASRSVRAMEAAAAPRSTTCTSIGNTVMCN